jgi:hypothetical protein
MRVGFLAGKPDLVADRSRAVGDLSGRQLSPPAEPACRLDGAGGLLPFVRKTHESFADEFLAAPACRPSS